MSIALISAIKMHIIPISFQDFLREGGHKGKVEVGDFFTPSALEKEGQFREAFQNLN